MDPSDSTPHTGGRIYRGDSGVTLRESLVVSQVSQPGGDLGAKAIESAKLPDTVGLTLLGQSTDIVNTGIREARGIVWIGAGGLGGGEVSFLSSLNQELKNYILFLPHELLAGAVDLPPSVTPKSLAPEHFSNAAALIEVRQPPVMPQAEARSVNDSAAVFTPARELGSLHFRRLYGGSQILFVGEGINPESLLSLPGSTYYRDCFTRIWDANLVVVNSAEINKGVVYLVGPPRIASYALALLEDFADELYQVVRHTDGGPLQQRADAYASVVRLIPAAQPVIGFDPFLINHDQLESVGGAVVALNKIDQVLATVFDHIPSAQALKLTKYLLELKGQISQRVPGSGS